VSHPADPVQNHALPIDPDLAPSDPAEPTVIDQDVATRSHLTGRRAEPSVLAAIALGGALGAPARHGLAQLVHVAPGSFPWATFATNITGSFALGLVLALVLERFPPTRYLRPFVATGFLGAYTTYSTFAVETDLLIKDGHAAIALAYAAASLLVGFIAVWAGIWAARTLPLPHRGGPR
jgi:fluoride exporter